MLVETYLRCERDQDSELSLTHQSTWKGMSSSAHVDVQGPRLLHHASPTLTTHLLTHDLYERV